MVRQGYTGYNAAISVGGQAADGMRLARDNGTVATTAKELESASAFRKRVIDDLKSLEALRNAPVVSAEDYHGPVLFSGDAAADVMNRLFIPNVEADRPEMGTTARTTGAYTSSFHARVLPEFLSATDDPLADNLRRPRPARRLRRRRRRRARAVGQRRRQRQARKLSHRPRARPGLPRVERPRPRRRLPGRRTRAPAS